MLLCVSVCPCVCVCVCVCVLALFPPVQNRKCRTLLCTVYSVHTAATVSAAAEVFVPPRGASYIASEPLVGFSNRFETHFNNGLYGPPLPTHGWTDASIVMLTAPLLSPWRGWGEWGV